MSAIIRDARCQEDLRPAAQTRVPVLAGDDAGDFEQVFDDSALRAGIPADARDGFCDCLAAQGASGYLWQTDFQQSSPAFRVAHSRDTMKRPNESKT